MPRSSAEKVHPQSGSHRRPSSGTEEHQQKASEQQPETSVHPVEPEDAYLTGTSRSLQRRVLGLNVDGEGRGQANQHPETPAGQHATGSFAGGKTDRLKRG